jgi:two-component system, chemotaxis family, chemotaxis protein CheY
MKVLIVDDDSTTRIVLQRILSRYGEVHSCIDGTEAVQACTMALEHDDPYDLICMDIFMPTMDGLAALKLIRQEEERHGRSHARRAKVIITTASEDDESIHTAFQQLCDAYIVKPIDATELLNIVYCLCPVEERAL